MEHIATNKSFDTGNVIEDYKCMVCKKVSNAMITWVGVECPNCKFMADISMFRGHIVRAQRQYLKLTRKQLGKKLGYSKNTIMQYEWCKCPDTYWNKMQQLMESNAKDD